MDDERILLCVNWLISVKQVLNCCASSFLYVLHGNEFSNTYIQKQFFSIDQAGFDMWDGLWLISPCIFYSKLYKTQNVEIHFVIISLMISSQLKEISWNVFCEFTCLVKDKNEMDLTDHIIIIVNFPTH